MWKPFDARFQDIVEVFTEHGQIIRNELLLLQSQSFQDFTGEAAQERLRTDEARAARNAQLEHMEQCNVDFQNQIKSLCHVYCFKGFSLLERNRSSTTPNFAVDQSTRIQFRALQMRRVTRGRDWDLDF